MSRSPLLVLALAACSRVPAKEVGGQARTPGLRLVEVARGLDSPVHLAAPPGDARLFIVEQDGRIRIVANGVLQPQPFLDITARVRSGGERGLLSVAFHPQFAENGRFFVNYTDREGDTRVAEFHARPGDAAADPSSERPLLHVRQPYANHNGGHVLFGPDGMLYVGMGDGGAAGDPHGNAQDRRTLLGKLLRLNVDGGTPTPEIWALGLRNPWRFAFDTVSGLLFIADVGQNRWEEINAVRADSPGVNYGWRTMEGAHCFLNPFCRKTGLLRPVHDYGHGEGCSITGGVVYRGRAIPMLVGHYLYGDWCGGWLKSFRMDGSRAVDHRTWDVPPMGAVTSFGVDGQGEVYVLGGGTAWRIAAAS